MKYIWNLIIHKLILGPQKNQTKQQNYRAHFSFQAQIYLCWFFNQSIQDTFQKILSTKIEKKLYFKNCFYEKKIKFNLSINFLRLRLYSNTKFSKGKMGSLPLHQLLFFLVSIYLYPGFEPWSLSLSSKVLSIRPPHRAERIIGATEGAPK